MFAEEIRRAIPATPRGRLADLSAAVWKGFAAGAVSEDDAQALAEAIEARKAIPVAPPAERRRVGSRPRSSASLERRRAWAASSWLPPAIAARFTQGEAAALGVVMAEIAITGACELCHGAVAGRAGVSVSTVKRAIGEARKLDFISVEERRLSWCRNLPNVVTIASAELRTWVATRGRGLRAARAAGGGVQIGTSSKAKYLSSSGKPAAAAQKMGIRRDVKRDFAWTAPSRPRVLMGGHQLSERR